MKCGLSIASVAIAVAVTCSLDLPPGPVRAQTPLTRTDFEIRTLSTRPDTVSGGNVLVQITIPGTVASDNVSVALNGRDVRAAFRVAQEPSSLIGLVSGLQAGKNQLEVGANGKQRKLTLVNHPIAGPVISGPQQTPFICETETLGLGPALDANCSANTRVEYFYRSTAVGAPNATGRRGGGSLCAGRSGRPRGVVAQVTDEGWQVGRGAQAANPWKPYDPAAPRPADLAMTTTTDGHMVPYIVRREMGTINRAVYVISFLHEPGQPLPAPGTTTPGWNGKLIYSFGPGCGAGYHQGRNVGGLNGQRNHLEDGQLGDYGLAKGYAVAGASLNAFGTTCADLISAETMMMVKEHFIEQFGVPRYTIGSGRSGGSMQQHMIANNYPGLLDGIIPTASFADTITFNNTLFDCELLEHAFTTSSLTWTVEQKTAVAGQKTFEYCTNNGTRYPNLRAATNFDQMAIPAAQAYNPATNPKGARFTYQDNMVNVFGRDPKTGFARRPLDNVGIQYGLAAFNAGQISFEQFLDLNARVGGHDIDGGIIAGRTVADSGAIRIAYQTGRVNDTGRGMRAVPIMDVRPYTDGTPDVHDIVNSYITRARLIAANGSADNQVLHIYAPGAPIVRAQADVLDTMDKWLSNIARDDKPARTSLEKVVRNKPAEAVDACYTASLEQMTDRSRCQGLFPVFSNPRLVAGAPTTNDVLKCELRPVDRRDYKRPVSDAQFAGLKTVFTQGVCDFSRKGAGRSAPDTWLSYPHPGESTGLIPLQ